MIIAKFIAATLIGYLLGSIPCGLIVSKIKSGIDIREYGSGKIGGTNVMRTLGMKAGILTIVLDLAKAAGAVLLAKEIVGGASLNPAIAEAMAGLAAVAGHNWSIFLKFKGGRGVASFFGTLLVISPPVALFGAEVLAISALRSRYMSLGSILGVIAAWCLMIPLTIKYNWSPIYLVYGLVATALVVYQHRDNIKRLQQGTERRLGEKGGRIT